jgi:hypothetical protein
MDCFVAAELVESMALSSPQISGQVFLIPMLLATPTASQCPHGLVGRDALDRDLPLHVNFPAFDTPISGGDVTLD